MGKKKLKRTAKASSGLTHQRRAKREIRDLKIKITRWKKNSSVNKPHQISKDHECRRCCRSRHDNWNTAGLEKRLKQCEARLKIPAKSA